MIDPAILLEINILMATSGCVPAVVVLLLFVLSVAAVLVVVAVVVKVVLVEVTTFVFDDGDGADGATFSCSILDGNIVSEKMDASEAIVSCAGDG
jgi:hypothetical protein